MSNLGLSVAPQRRTSPARRDRNRLFRQPRDQRRIVGRLGDDADMAAGHRARDQHDEFGVARVMLQDYRRRSEEHTSELQSLMRISYAVFCLKKKKTRQNYTKTEE